MKLYRISQDANNDYDSFDSAVVCAPDDATARNMNPRNGEPMTEKDWSERFGSWCSSPDQVTVKYLGAADDTMTIGIVCASFNAG